MENNQKSHLCQSSPHNLTEFCNYFKNVINQENLDYHSNDMICSMQVLPAIGNFAKQNLIYPESVVINLNTPTGFYMNRKKYRSYQIQYTTTGHGKLVYDNIEYDLEAGDCFLSIAKRNIFFIP